MISPSDLAKSELFAGVPSGGLSEIAKSARIRKIPKNTTIFTQGDVARRAHALVSGRVRIVQSDRDGAQLLVRFIGPGQTFGTMGLFTGNTYPAHAITVVDTIEASWTEKDIFKLMSRYPQIALNILRMSGQRLREMQERLAELASQRVERRIAHNLLRIAEQGGTETQKGLAIEFPVSRKDLAEMCGATLHTVSRTLRIWERAGRITTSRQKITVCDLAGLRQLTWE